MSHASRLKYGSANSVTYFKFYVQGLGFSHSLGALCLGFRISQFVFGVLRLEKKVVG